MESIITAELESIITLDVLESIVTADLKSVITHVDTHRGIHHELESIITAELEFIVTALFNAGLKSVVTAELVICNAFS